MKANKFFAVAMAALALAACVPTEKPGENPGKDDPKDPSQETELALSETNKTIEVGENFTLEATVAVEFTSSKEGIVTLEAAGDKAVKVTGAAEGSTVLTATTKGGQSKTCVVKVAKKQDPNQQTGSLKGSQVWVIVLDGETYKENESKIVASFQENGTDAFFWIWPNTGDSYTGGDGEGLNSLGRNGYLALQVGGIGWSGAGFCLTEAGETWKAAKELNDAIVANPDQYALHLAIKSTDDQAHTFYWMDTDATKVVLGAAAFDGGKVIGDFPRDGGWHEFDIEMADYAAALAKADVKAGVNVFSMLSGGVQGRQLNLDAVYFYKK